MRRLGRARELVEGIAISGKSGVPCASDHSHEERSRRKPGRAPRPGAAARRRRAMLWGGPARSRPAVHPARARPRPHGARTPGAAAPGTVRAVRRPTWSSTGRILPGGWPRPRGHRTAPWEASARHIGAGQRWEAPAWSSASLPSQTYQPDDARPVLCSSARTSTADPI